MNNFYDYFEIMKTASMKEVILAYENKITKYNNLVSFTQEQINEIKLLKKGLYILTNKKLREKYDKKIENLNITSNEPSAGNENEFQSFDNLFNVDNSWMKNVELNNTKNIDPNKLESRIFSLSSMNKKSFSPDSELLLRKKKQGREENN